MNVTAPSLSWIRLRLSPARHVLVSAARRWVEDRGPSMGAAIAFYTVFSLGPSLFLMIAVAGLVSGTEQVEQAMIEEFSALIGADGAAVIAKMIHGAAQAERKGLAALIGTALLLVAATTVFAEIQQSLNIIWRVPTPTGSIFRELVRERLTSLALIVVMGFILLVALVVSAGLSAASEWLSFWMPGVMITLWVGNALVSFIVVTVLFAANYRILPDTYVSWRDAWIGALIASLLFALGKFLIAQYIGSTGVVSVLGAAGTPIVVLLWVYYSAQIFLLGAEVAKVNADYRGTPDIEVLLARRKVPGGGQG
ncbi:MAG: YihY/virulence factor BrkB family protein [Alphaproteobacteria bacterium]|nr:YihY/virulence factor BrkB family protein [Alphaproteobacteria bacterium]